MSTETMYTDVIIQCNLRINKYIITWLT